ncbi:hypothetical protein [uncultured Hydrogenophaga sp.]|uniref:hypothetical protein n=1 Tax=uncultured Hydrogenophaga sp. TaxID=199683 RepID=UPI002584A5EC|nr:hypothetical protein [uncultured Hydrogenophaga sp.]
MARKESRTARLATANERVVTTVRLEPALHAELAALGELEHASFNQVVEAGMRHYVLHRRDVLEQRLERALKALRARPKGGDFDAAIARLVEAEATLGGDDPAQGRLGRLSTDAQTMPAADKGLAARVRSLMAAG